MATHVVRFSMDISGSVISPLVMGQVNVSEFQTALAEVSIQFFFLLVFLLKRKTKSLMWKNPRILFTSHHDPGSYVQVDKL